MNWRFYLDLGKGVSKDDPNLPARFVSLRYDLKDENILANKSNVSHYRTIEMNLDIPDDFFDLASVEVALGEPPEEVVRGVIREVKAWAEVKDPNS